MSLLDLGYFDASVSSFVIYHLKHERKHSLCKETDDMLNPTGVFCNLEHMAPSSVELHIHFLNSIGYTGKKEDRANRILPMETQQVLSLRANLVDVDYYYWKWLKMVF